MGACSNHDPQPTGKRVVISGVTYVVTRCPNCGGKGTSPL